MLRRRLQELNGLWRSGRRDAALLVEGAETLSHWSFVGLDEMEVADAVQAKALAMLVLAQTASGQPLAEVESLVAARMGYEGHALAAASRLPENTPWRLYLEHKDEQLALRLNEAPGQDKYLLLRRLAESNRMEAWVNVLERSYGDKPSAIHALASCLYSSEFFPRRFISANLHRLVLYHLLRESGLPTPGDPAAAGGIAMLLSDEGQALLVRFLETYSDSMATNFDTWLATLGGDMAGPFLDRPVFEAYYRGYFFSGLYHYGNHLLRQYNVVDAAAQFAQVFGQAKQGMAAEFGLWYGNLVAAEQGAIDAGELFKDLDRLPSFGLPPLQKTLEEGLRRLEFGSPQVQAMVAKVWRRGDSRIEHRYFLGNALHEQVMDLSGAERVYRSILRDNPNASLWLKAWMANYNGDNAQLLAMAADESLPLKERSHALSLASYSEADDAAIRQAYERLAAKAPEQWDALSRYADYLHERKENTAIVQKITPWIENHGLSSQGFDAPRARIALSRALLDLGRPQEAWLAVKDEVPGDYGPVLSHSVKVLLALDKLDAAEQLARHEAGRYAGSLPSLMSLVEVYWRKGAYAEAAATLKNWRHPITVEDWRWTIGESFSKTFAKRRDAAPEAFAAMLHTGLNPWDVRNIATTVWKNGDAATAFLMQKQVRVGGPGYVEILVHAYRYLRDSQGRDAALAWLGGQIPAGLRNMASMVYFGEREYDLLWDLIERPEDGDNPNIVWLFRAAASLADPKLAPARRQALLEHYRQPNEEHYHTLGRYLLRLEEESAVAERTLAPRQVCEAAFYLGWRAKSERRYVNAADWFLTSLDTGLKQCGEYGWSLYRLYTWRNLNKSLELLAQREE